MANAGRLGRDRSLSLSRSDASRGGIKIHGIDGKDAAAATVGVGISSMPLQLPDPRTSRDAGPDLSAQTNPMRRDLSGHPSHGRLPGVHFWKNVPETF